LIMVIAMAINLPYLFYTHHLTGKFLYWGSAGGDSMYWMSTPIKNEYGDWQSFNDIIKNSHLNSGEIISKNEILKSNHIQVFDKIAPYNSIERDDILKSIAINNIKTYPIKYLQNCICNIGRILFNYPYSYTLQKPATLARVLLNGFLAIMTLICLIPTLVNWRKIIYPVRILLLLTFLYLGGSVLGSAETRMFTVIVPVLLIWIPLIIQKTVRIRIKWVENQYWRNDTNN
jgi:hypothetical protein